MKRSLPLSDRRCYESVASFVRYALPHIRQAAASVPTLQGFAAVRDRGKTKFVRTKRPNWWQIPSRIRSTLLSSPEGTLAAEAIERSSPFAEVIGKTIGVETGGTSYGSGADVLRSILVSYLFEAGPARWRSSVLDTVWSGFSAYCSTAEGTVAYRLVAPIANMPGVQPIRLEPDLSIETLPANEMALLAERHHSLRGVEFGCFRHQVLLRSDRHVHDGGSSRPARVRERQHVA